MTARMPEFRQAARIAIEDIRLQTSLESATARFRSERVHALADFPGADELRDHFKQIRHNTLVNLCEQIITFEKNAQAAGAQVHWALDAAQACEIIVQLAQARGVKQIVKSKSMATEEVHLNQALENAEITPVETDLGEWIVQLAGETPSHIIAPAVHKSREQVAELFRDVSGQPVEDDIPALTAVARRMLRQRFLQADMGISGGNIAVAETGSIVIITNEGNARMVTSLPKVHVVLIGIEKIAPTWNEAAPWLALLARSATGQPLSIYTTVITGPRKLGETDGPDEVHIVLLDNGRSKLLGTPFEEVLQCIRCGACLNICPVYREAGGYAYGSPYSGPIGAVISPLLFGLADHAALPQASSLCGACLDVCPVRIDLPRMLLALREEEVGQRILPWHETLLERLAAQIFQRESLLRIVTKLMRWGQGIFLRNGRIHLPGSQKPLPALAKRSFRELWHSGELDE